MGEAFLSHYTLSGMILQEGSHSHPLVICSFLRCSPTAHRHDRFLRRHLAHWCPHTWKNGRWQSWTVPPSQKGCWSGPLAKISPLAYGLHNLQQPFMHVCFQEKRGEPPKFIRIPASGNHWCWRIPTNWTKNEKFPNAWILMGNQEVPHVSQFLTFTQ